VYRSEAITRGIRVQVQSRYLPERSDPEADYHFFVYAVRITNLGEKPAQLISRHWVITDADGNTQEVQGEGVVGEQPHLESGESFEYTSACPLDTPVGAMQGTYQMVDADGDAFDAEVAPFTLAMTEALH
jgi:ApaG protein